MKNTLSHLNPPVADAPTGRGDWGQGNESGVGLGGLEARLGPAENRAPVLM